MARTLSATYLTAQQAQNKQPYLKLLFEHKTEADVDLSSDSATYGNRILMIDHVEEPYNDYATIIFRNVARDIPELKGYYIGIGYGYVTTAGNEYLGDGNNEPAPPRLWVKHQQTVSAAGKLWEVIELEGKWARLREGLLRMGDPPLYTVSFETDTIYDIIGLVLAEFDMTLEALAEDDGIIDVLQPQFDINSMPFDYAQSVLYRLLNMTASYLKPLDALKWEIKYPHADDSIDADFYSYQAPYFYEYMERRNILRPNHIYVFGNEGTEALWEDYIVGEALDQDEIDAYEDIVRIILSGTLTQQADVDARAAAILARAKFEQLAGRMLAPNDSRVELYDRLGITDTRGS